MRIAPIALACLSLAIAACAAHRDPIIDMQGVDPNALARDWADCESYAEEVRVSEGVARGATAGAAIGAIAGAINDDVSQGAANGALYGGARSGLEADRDKQRVMKRCLAGRGYRVLN